MGKPKLYVPAACRPMTPDELEGVVRSEAIMELKYDGARYLLYTRQGHLAQLLSRNPSVNGGIIDKLDRFPVLADAGVDGVFDGEVIIPAGDKSSETTRLMGCSAEKAQQRLASGKIKPAYAVFDVLELNGVDVTTQPFARRRELLESLAFRVPQIQLAEQYQVSRSTLEGIWARGGEGVIVKSLDAPYGQGWSKIKCVWTYDVVVTGYKPGNGKYKGMVGAVLFSVYDGASLVEIGQTSGMTDTQRLWMTENFETLRGQVIEVGAQEFTGKRLRHPRFVRLRPDKAAKQCTLAAVRAVGQVGHIANTKVRSKNEHDCISNSLTQEAVKMAKKKAKKSKTKPKVMKVQSKPRSPYAGKAGLAKFATEVRKAVKGAGYTVQTSEAGSRFKVMGKVDEKQVNLVSVFVGCSRVRGYKPVLGDKPPKGHKVVENKKTYWVAVGFTTDEILNLLKAKLR